MSSPIARINERIVRNFFRSAAVRQGITSDVIVLVFEIDPAKDSTSGAEFGRILPKLTEELKFHGFTKIFDKRQQQKPPGILFDLGIEDKQRALKFAEQFNIEKLRDEARLRT